MALDATRLANDIFARIVARNSNTSSIESTLKPYIEDLAAALVQEIEQADILPGSFQDAEARPITGVGEIT